MKTVYALLVIALTFFSTAEGHLVPCQGDFVLEGEYLYLQPLFEDTAYVARTIPNASQNLLPTQREMNTFDGHSGGRITGKYGLCCFPNDYVSIGWMYIQGKNQNFVSSTDGLLNLARTKTWTGQTSNTVLSDPFSGTASSRITLNYHDVDLCITHHLVDDCCVNFYFLGGVQFLSVDYLEAINYKAATLNPNNGNPGGEQDNFRTQHWGVGLKGGFDIIYTLPQFFDCGIFSIHGKMTGALLISQNKSSYEFLVAFASMGNPVQTKFTTSNERFYHTVPGCEFKLGLDYAFSFCNRCSALEVGYNLIYYASVIDEVRYVGNPRDPAQIQFSTAAASFDHYTSLTLHGLYAGLNVRF